MLKLKSYSSVDELKKDLDELSVDFRRYERRYRDIRSVIKYMEIAKSDQTSLINVLEHKNFNICYEYLSSLKEIQNRLKNINLCIVHQFEQQDQIDLVKSEVEKLDSQINKEYDKLYNSTSELAKQIFPAELKKKCLKIYKLLKKRLKFDKSGYKFQFYYLNKENNSNKITNKIKSINNTKNDSILFVIHMRFTNLFDLNNYSNPNFYISIGKCGKQLYFDCSTELNVPNDKSTNVFKNIKEELKRLNILIEKDSSDKWEKRHVA